MFANRTVDSAVTEVHETPRAAPRAPPSSRGPRSEQKNSRSVPCLYPQDTTRMTQSRTEQKKTVSAPGISRTNPTRHTAVPLLGLRWDNQSQCPEHEITS